jgi:hypothetical protein
MRWPQATTMAKLSLGCASLALVTALGHWGCSFAVDEPLGPTLDTMREFRVEGPHELVGATQRAVTRINRATCLGVTMPRTRGIVIEYAPTENAEACSETVIRTMPDQYVISVGISVAPEAPPGTVCADLETAVLHEVIHAMRSESDIPKGTQPAGHAQSTTSVFYYRAAANAKLDSEALVAICEYQPCSCFNPEE